MSKKNEVTAQIFQKPVEVRLTCRICGYENEYDYSDFCGQAGDPPEWNSTEFECEGCGKTMTVDGQDWD